MSKLFSPYHIKSLELKNRVVLSPMCQYSVFKEDGIPNEWHYVHYISRAVGGAGLIITEMTDVHPDGRISVHDLGLWDDQQVPAFARIIEQLHHYGAKAGIQIAHAGRKAESPSLDIVGPSAIPFSDRYRTPRALTTDEIKKLVDDFAASTKRALQAGVDTIELHGAHGYLLHQFMSPTSNQRTDEYQEPTRFTKEVIEAVRAVMPSEMPLILRVSAVEYQEGGYSLEDMVGYCQVYKKAGIDLLDVSSGGNAPVLPPHTDPGYQVPFATALKEKTGLPVIAVGRLEDPQLAEATLQTEKADLIAIARGFLRDAYWANTASLALGDDVIVPKQYARGF